MTEYILTFERTILRISTFDDIFTSYFWFDESGHLIVQFPGYESIQLHSYGGEWSDTERVSDVHKILKEKICSGLYWPKIKLYQEVK